MNTAEYIEFLETEIHALDEKLGEGGWELRAEMMIRAERNRLIDKIYSCDGTDAEDDWIMCSDKMPDDLQEVIGVWVNHDPPHGYEHIRDVQYTAPFICYKGEWHWWSKTCGDYLAEYGKADFEKIDKAIEVICWKPMPNPPLPF